MDILLFGLLVSIGINLVMFVPAYLFRTDKITDISYAVTFAVVAIAGFTRSSQLPLHKLLTVIVLLWAFRLGAFLFIRINKMGKDSRFDGMREKFFLFIRFWLLQGLTVFVVMLSSLLAYKQVDTHVGVYSIIGALIAIFGIAIEGIADWQKFVFNNNPANKGKWIDKGIWRASRHPNYLGEMMMWTGIYIVVLPILHGMSIWYALISPLYIIGLLLFVSGVPLLEKSAEKKWGSLKEYRSYVKHVPVVVPSLRSIKRIFTR